MNKKDKRKIAQCLEAAEQQLRGALRAFPKRELTESEFAVAKEVTKTAGTCQRLRLELIPPPKPKPLDNFEVPDRKDVTFTVFTPDGGTITSPVVGPGAPNQEKVDMLLKRLREYPELARRFDEFASGKEKI